MRHKYPTEGIVLGRRPLAEESALVTVLTKEVGLVYARAQGVKKSGAKLASALQTLSEADVILVAGKDGWRITGALLRENWFKTLTKEARERASRVTILTLRLVTGEAPDPALYDIFSAFLQALRDQDETLHDSVECLAVLRILTVLGLDTGELPLPSAGFFAPEVVSEIAGKRTMFIARANKGIAASGL